MGSDLSMWFHQPGHNQGMGGDPPGMGPSPKKKHEVKISPQKKHEVKISDTEEPGPWRSPCDPNLPMNVSVLIAWRPYGDKRFAYHVGHFEKREGIITAVFDASGQTQYLRTSNSSWDYKIAWMPIPPI